jgi:hypothetical protein
MLHAILPQGSTELTEAEQQQLDRIADELKQIRDLIREYIELSLRQQIQRSPAGDKLVRPLLAGQFFRRDGNSYE